MHELSVRIPGSCGHESNIDIREASMRLEVARNRERNYRRCIRVHLDHIDRGWSGLCTPGGDCTHRLHLWAAPREAVAKLASSDKVIMVTWANFHYLDYVLNWVTHVLGIGVSRCANLRSACLHLGFRLRVFSPPARVWGFG
jgi:hypothetical protein